MGQKTRRKVERSGKGGPERGALPSARQRPWGIASVVLGVLLILAGVGTWLWNGTRGTAEAAPRFALPASTGRMIALEEYLGKQEVVLLFYMTAT